MGLLHKAVEKKKKKGSSFKLLYLSSTQLYQLKRAFYKEVNLYISDYSYFSHKVCHCGTDILKLADVVRLLKPLVLQEKKNITLTHC